MDLNFTEEELFFQTEVRAFLAENLTPELARAQQMTPTVVLEPEIYTEWHKILYARGWVAPHWPKEYGGPGWSPAQRYIFELECARVDAPLLPTIGLRMVGPVIMGYGSDAQKQKYLPRILSGDDIWCQGYSESGAGSDLAALKTRAVREGEFYRVSGSKIWTTYGHHANLMFTLVRTGDSGRRQEGISCLIIDMNWPGVIVRPIHTIGGDHDVNEVFLDDVMVPAENLVAEEGKGWTTGKYLLQFERGVFASARLRRHLDHVIDLIGLRAGIPRDAALVSRIAALDVDVETLAMTELRVMSALQAGQNAGAMSSQLKIRVSELRQAITRLAVDLLGYDALVWTDHRPLYALPEEPVIPEQALVVTPEYLNTRAVTIYGGAAEIQRDILAKSILDL